MLYGIVGLSFKYINYLTDLKVLVFKSCLRNGCLVEKLLSLGNCDYSLFSQRLWIRDIYSVTLSAVFGLITNNIDLSVFVTTCRKFYPNDKLYLHNCRKKERWRKRRRAVQWTWPNATKPRPVKHEDMPGQKNDSSCYFADFTSTKEINIVNSCCRRLLMCFVCYQINSSRWIIRIKREVRTKSGILTLWTGSWYNIFLVFLQTYCRYSFA